MAPYDPARTAPAAAGRADRTRARRSSGAAATDPRHRTLEMGSALRGCQAGPRGEGARERITHQGSARRVGKSPQPALAGERSGCSGGVLQKPSPAREGEPVPDANPTAGSLPGRLARDRRVPPGRAGAGPIFLSREVFDMSGTWWQGPVTLARGMIGAAAMCALDCAVLRRSVRWPRACQHWLQVPWCPSDLPAL